MKITKANGEVFSTVKVELEVNEKVKADVGAMICMDSCIDIKAKTQGKGLGGMFKAAIGGESIFTTEATAIGQPGEIIFAPNYPGDIKCFDLSNNRVYCKGGSFLAGSADLDISVEGSFKGVLSGAGLFLQKISGTGVACISVYGSIIEKELGPTDSYCIDTGHLLAFEESVSYTVNKAAKGLFSTLASGEGLVCNMQGPGKVWIQTRNIKGLADVLMPFMPKQSSN